LPLSGFEPQRTQPVASRYTDSYASAIYVYFLNTICSESKFKNPHSLIIYSYTVKFLENTSRLRVLHIQKYPSNCVLDSTE
jgi:hypothetical protein